VAFAFFCFACSQNPRIRKINGDVIDSKEVDEIVTRLMQTAHVTGLCLAVLNDNESIYIRTYGYKNSEKKELLNESTIMLGASLSKAVFSYVVMQLVQENVLELDRPLYQYLDRPIPEYVDYADLADDDRWKWLTARHCLSHTTGFPNVRFINPRGNRKLEFFFEPGSRYAYSGEGIQLLQFVLEHVTNKGLEELARERVFQPLNMERSSFIWQERFEGDYALGHDIIETPIDYRRMTRASASGSLLTTISDYARFVEAVMKSRGLDTAIRKTMLSPAIKIHSVRQFPTLTNETTAEYESIGLSYGLGWGCFTCPYGPAFFKEGHGNGWQNYNVNFIDQATSIVIMTNSDNGEKIFKDLLEEIIGDTFTPWDWEGYIPHNLMKRRPVGVYLYDVILLENVDMAIEKYRRIKGSPLKEDFIFDEEQLDALGAQMIKEKKMEDAIALLKLNIEEYPNSARVYYSMGEAYRLIGQVDLAIENYEKSLELDPHNPDVRRIRQQIKTNE
jgi:CubicO group peptidase (beta-lactamase class C family)